MSGANPRRRARAVTKRTLLAGALLAGIVAGYGPNAGAVHDDGLFELDGNAVNETKADPDFDGEDWDVVFGGTDTASVSSFVTDAVNAAGRDTTIFTQGGSKDDLDTPNWRHTAGSVPDKDELTHAYAARYGDTLYFGANRFITNGDAQIGFWFFQEQVGALSGGTFGPGDHRDGDILILSDFTRGGGTPTVRVFEWNGPGGDIAGQGAINGTLDLLAGSTELPQDCDIVALGDNFCATVNDGTETSPWPYQAKSGPANVFPPGAFYEGGIDLAFLELEDECFSSFLAETRSSQSVDATLKDFVGGSFAQCAAAISTSPSPGAGGIVTPGTNVTDTVTITGGGVTNPPTPTGTVEFFLCGPLTSPAQCESQANKVGATKNVTESSPGVGTATSDAVDTTSLTPGRYCFLVKWSGDANYPGGPFLHNRNAPTSDASTVDSECFRVQDTSSTATAQTWLPNDSATVTLSGGGPAAGSVAFTLFTGGDCNAGNDDTQLYTQTVTLDSGGQASTTNTAVSVTTSQTVSWRTVFTPSDTSAVQGSSHCETTALTISN